jgi:hypothetical protein
MLITIKKYWLVSSRAVLYFIQTWGKADPWEWLWKRVHNPRCTDFESRLLIWVLLSQAWKEREYIRVLVTYRDFEDIVTSSWNEKWRERILDTIADAESFMAGKREPETERDFIVHRDYRPRVDEQ